MTTYGPAVMSLADRLAAADLVARIAGIELLRTDDDPLSETGRQLGTFRLTVAELIDEGSDGQLGDDLDVVVARDRDAPWPLPTTGEFVALVQLGSRGRPGQLVHNSAFPLADDTLVVDIGSGLGGGRARREKVALSRVHELIAERAERRRRHDAELEEREQSAFTPAPRSSDEMPEPDGLRTWLDLEHGEAGRSDVPLDAPRSQRPRGDVVEGS